MTVETETKKVRYGIRVEGRKATEFYALLNLNQSQYIFFPKLVELSLDDRLILDFVNMMDKKVRDAPRASGIFRVTRLSVPEDNTLKKVYNLELERILDPKMLDYALLHHTENRIPKDLRYIFITVDKQPIRPSNF